MTCNCNRSGDCHSQNPPEKMTIFGHEVEPGYWYRVGYYWDGEKRAVDFCEKIELRPEPCPDCARLVHAIRRVSYLASIWGAAFAIAGILLKLSETYKQSGSIVFGYSSISIIIAVVLSYVACEFEKGHDNHTATVARNWQRKEE